MTAGAAASDPGWVRRGARVRTGRIAFARIVDDANGVEAVYVVNTDGIALRQVVPPTLTGNPYAEPSAATLAAGLLFGVGAFVVAAVFMGSTSAPAGRPLSARSYSA